MEEYSLSNKLVLYGQTPTDENTDDEIKLYMPKKRNRNNMLFSFCFKICRFLTLVVAFFLLYYCLYQLYVKSALPQENVPTAVTPAITSAEDTEEYFKLELPFVINESANEINIEEYFGNEDHISLPQGKGIKVLIVNSHSSEFASSSLSVSDLGEDLAKILSSRGISTYFDSTVHDEAGTIGAYSRMSESISDLQKKYNEAVVVIDIHDSSSGAPVTFTVGTSDGFAWQENLRLVCSIYKGMKKDDVAIRILPTALGQNNGLLTLNVGIGGKFCDDSTARALLASVADALTIILKNEPLA